MRAALVFTAISLIVLAGNGWGREFTLADLKASQCGTTLWSWSQSSDKAPFEVSNGVVIVRSDGHGKFVSGTLRQEIVSGPAAKAVCTWNLTGGNYTIKADGSGLSNTSWKLTDTSDPRCADLKPGGYAKEGFDPALKSADPNTASVKFYLVAPNQGYQLAVGPLGFGGGNCAKIE